MISVDVCQVLRVLKSHLHAWFAEITTGVIRLCTRLINAPTADSNSKIRKEDLIVGFCKSLIAVPGVVCA
jgi:hypothetical protein